MNHPELEICKIIGVEFPDSEFVYYFDGRGPNYPTGDRKTIIRISQNEDFKHWYIIAPAPTCEELGEYLHHKAKAAIVLDHKFNWRLNSPTIRNKFLCRGEQGEATETQARAEAVRQIMEEE